MLSLDVALVSVQRCFLVPELPVSARTGVTRCSKVMCFTFRDKVVPQRISADLGGSMRIHSVKFVLFTP